MKECDVWDTEIKIPLEGIVLVPREVFWFSVFGISVASQCEQQTNCNAMESKRSNT